MTVDTIKNVLMRIISINKNMSEDSLNNLLVASGWDQSDIKEGINIYRTYKLSGSNSESINEYRPTKIVNIVTGDNSTFKENVSMPEMKVTQIPVAKVEMLEPLSAEKQKNIISLMDQDKINQDSPISQSTDINLMSSVPSIKDVTPKVEIHSIDNNTESSHVKTEEGNMVVHQSHIDAAELKGYNRDGKSMFLVIVDVVLFFMTLGLLLYVLLS